jgi:hypothetical protein
VSATVTSMRPTTAAATVSYICCGVRLDHVKLESPGSTLSFTHCSRCMITRWYRGDQPADPAQALDLPETKPSPVSCGSDSAASGGPRS